MPRLPRHGDTPWISVVVAANGDDRALDACLAWVEPKCKAMSAQLVVVRRESSNAPARPEIHYVTGPATATLEELRALGMSEATGDITAVLDDSVSSDDGRLDGLTRRRGHAVSDQR